MEGLKTYKGRIYDFWLEFFEAKGIDNKPQFPVVSKIVKCCLYIAHEAADIEGGLSQSGLILSEVKT